MNNMNQRCGNCSQNCRKMPSMPESCNSCGCVDSVSINNDPLRGMPLGIGYVPWQQWECVYNQDEGLARGTIFPSLDLPFYGCIPRGYRCSKGGRA